MHRVVFTLLISASLSSSVALCMAVAAAARRCTLLRLDPAGSRTDRSLRALSMACVMRLYDYAHEQTVECETSLRRHVIDAKRAVTMAVVRDEHSTCCGSGGQCYHAKQGVKGAGGWSW